MESVVEGAKEKRMELHEKVERQLKQEVDREINGRINDSHGKIRSWQRGRVGTLGGYAAVSPDRGKQGKYAHGYITNALENGHRIRLSKNPKYVTKSRRLRAEGRGFYAAARTQAKRIGLEASEELAQWVKEQLEK